MSHSTGPKTSFLQPCKSFYICRISDDSSRFLLRGRMSAQSNHVCCVAWRRRRRMVGRQYEVCQQHILFVWTLVTQDYSGHTHPIISPVFYMHLPPSISSALIPLVFLPMNHLSACPHFRVFPNLALFWSRPCVVVKSSLETLSTLRTFIRVSILSHKDVLLLFHLWRIKIFISNADSIKKMLAWSPICLLSFCN